MTWDDAMDQYGSDKPDLRFGMKLVNMNQALEGTQFKVFKDIIEKRRSCQSHQRQGLQRHPAP